MKDQGAGHPRGRDCEVRDLRREIRALKECGVDLTLENRRGDAA
jgi:hypothetical protein